MSNEEFLDVVNRIMRDTPLHLLTEIDPDIHLDGLIIEPDVSFKKVKSPDYIEFVLRFGDDSKLIDSSGYITLTDFQRGYLKCLLETFCYNDERIEI